MRPTGSSLRRLDCCSVLFSLVLVLEPISLLPLTSCSIPTWDCLLCMHRIHRRSREDTARRYGAPPPSPHRTELSSRALLAPRPSHAAQNRQGLNEHALDQPPVVREPQAAEALREQSVALGRVAARAGAGEQRTANHLLPLPLNDSQVQLYPHDISLVQGPGLGAGPRTDGEVSVVESAA
eukprot:459886-Hanusia_phi.AAC.1